MKTKLYPLIAAGILALGGCQTWDRLSGEEKAAATGAAVGGAVGYGVSGGGAIGTVGGAAAGGLIGREVERRR